ncbi:OsmC family peroxiredoxin [Fibrisoma montanum]|uniref:OsmC family peroxiredoxin n=1 Tax=Fibrisoma montanum TaxID=2305895 RepID=A0A418M3R5_9BACT|nr:OsmC family protein [Fibrisoma montanum]RIV20422.1 OsmC family peroxiredoxin [Fibrisoma montanum]
MNITATIRNSRQQNDVTVNTQGNQKTITIPGKPAGGGSSVNGGELLFLALATCFCNDIYREAARRNMAIESVDVTVTGEFGGEGDPASNISYRVQIESDSPESEIQDLIHYVDTVAEIHNTLRKGVQVSLQRAD